MSTITMVGSKETKAVSMVQLAEADLAFQDRSFWYSGALHLASNRTISDDRVV